MISSTDSSSRLFTFHLILLLCSVTKEFTIALLIIVVRQVLGINISTSRTITLTGPTIDVIIEIVTTLLATIYLLALAIKWIKYKLVVVLFLLKLQYY